LFWAGENTKSVISTTFSAKVLPFYAMILRMAIMRASL